MLRLGSLMRLGMFRDHFVETFPLLVVSNVHQASSPDRVRPIRPCSRPRRAVRGWVPMRRICFGGPNQEQWRTMENLQNLRWGIGDTQSLRRLKSNRRNVRFTFKMSQRNSFGVSGRECCLLDLHLQELQETWRTVGSHRAPSRLFSILVRRGLLRPFMFNHTHRIRTWSCTPHKTGEQNLPSRRS